MKSFAWIAGLCLLAGCRVGPDRRGEAPVAMPQAFENASGTRGVQPVGRWWQAFGDPVLDELVERALRNNGDLKVALARVGEARAAAGIADAGYLPSLDFVAERQWLYASGEAAGLAGAGVRTGLVPREQDVYRTGLNASWEVDLFGAVARRVEQAQADVEAREAAIDGVALRVAAEVVSAYVDHRVASQRRALMQRVVDNLQRSVTVTESLLSAELATPDAVARVRAALAAERARPVLLGAEVAAARYRLAVLLGVMPQDFTVPEELGAWQVPERIATGVPGALLRRRPDLRGAEAEVAAATARVGIATADLYPRLFLLGGVALESRSADRLFRSSAVQAIGGPSLQLPLFRGTALRQALQAAEAGERAAIAGFAQRIVAAVADVEAAVHLVDAERRQLQASEAASAERVLVGSAARTRQAVGLASLGDTLEAERAELLADDAVQVARSRAAAAAVQLFLALGGGAEDVARR